MLWPEHDDSRARQALRNALHGLRRILGIDVIRSAGDQLVGVDYDRFICDAIDLEHQAANGILPEWDEPDPSMPFAGFHVARAPVFSEWLEQERLRLQALRTRAATRHGTIGAIDEASATTQRLVEVRPDRLRSPHDQDAYALYVRGNYMFLQAAHNGRLEDLDRSRECFERALALEPAYALAIAGLSNYYAVAAARGVIAPFHAGFGRAIELSQEALALDATLAVPHVHFGVKALYLDDDLPTALREFEGRPHARPEVCRGTTLSRDRPRPARAAESQHRRTGDRRAARTRCPDIQEFTGGGADRGG
ncbi:MAG: hypothetical protein U5K74_13910 [Gemmatimonadaceae bacterium]|nr:hypothetical protein [Gemmatimonadaceae bacterium]